MNPLLINTADRGGAAKACLRLHQGLLQQNINSKVLLRNKTNNEIPETYQISLHEIERSLNTKLTDKSIKILKELKLYKPKPDNFAVNRPKGLEMYSYPFSDYNILKSNLYQNADIINLHWVAIFLDYKLFFQNNKKPVVWTLHDQNPFLGVEHYAETIIGIDKKGYPIKRNISEKEKNIFQENLKIKKEALFNFENLHIVAPSIWLSEEAKQSELFGKYKVRIIPYGLDTDTFKPRNKTYSRELLNIPQDKKVILFVADSISNHRKGFIYLQQAFELLKNENTVLLSVGSKNSELNKLKNYRELGRIRDELLMSIIYSIADVFVIPSLMDNLPNTVLESIMCGTPVIGFPVGGIPDMVQDGENGYLTEEISVPALFKTIEKFLESPDVFDRSKIRENAVEKYDLKIQAINYIELYQQILK